LARSPHPSMHLRSRRLHGARNMGNVALARAGVRRFRQGDARQEDGDVDRGEVKYISRADRFSC
jgi:hypothetical protein